MRKKHDRRSKHTSSPLQYIRQERRYIYVYVCICICIHVYILWIYYREREKKKLSIVERIAPTRDSKRGDGTDGRIHDDTISRNMSRIDEYVEESLG